MSPRLVQGELLPMPELTAAEKDAIVESFERMIMESIRLGGGFPCKDAMQAHLKRERVLHSYGHKNRRYSHKRTGGTLEGR